MKNATLGFRIKAELSDNSVISALGYARNDIAEITSNGLNRIVSPADSLIALQNEKFFIGGKRDNKFYGGMLEYTTRLSERDNFKAGVGGEAFPLSEYLTFAVTNQAVSTEDSSGGDNRYQPYDITRPGGKPFLVYQSRDGNRFFAYVQDVIPYEKWNFNVGLRYDYYNLFSAENNISV